MLSNLLVTSKSNLKLIKHCETLSACKVLLVDHPANKKPEVFNGRVYALGGGSVLDTAKMMSGKRPCYAIPTNACGAAMTSHAVVWTKTKKINVPTTLPILVGLYKTLPIKLSSKNTQRTIYDCFCHILESKFSSKANYKSLEYCRLAEYQLYRYFAHGRMINLIEAGNLAGMAIEITGTNMFHAISYVFTLDYGLCHGDALREALRVKSHKDYDKILNKARKYEKFFESTLL